jgi:hypothetical protein
LLFVERRLEGKLEGWGVEEGDEKKDRSMHYARYLVWDRSQKQDSALSIARTK